MKRAMAHKLTKVGQGFATALLLVLFCSLASAQGWEATFGGELEDDGLLIVPTIDEGTLAIGFSQSFGSDNDDDIYIVRTDVDGTLVWETAHDEGYIERANDVLPTQNGEHLLVGSINEVDGTQAGTPSQVYLLNIDYRGRLLWSRRYNNGGLFQGGTKIIPTTDGGYAILGYTESASEEDNDILLLKLDSEFNEEWRQTYGTPYTDGGEGLVETENGFTFAANVKNGPNQNGQDFNDNDIAIYRVGATGSLISVRVYAGSDEENVSVTDVTRTNDDHLMIVGSTRNFGKALIMKSDLNGDTLWTREIEPSPADNVLNAVLELSDGNYVATGYASLPDTDPGILLVKFTSEGEILWSRIIGDEFYDTRFGEDVAEAIDGSLLVAGSRARFGGIFGFDVSVIRLSEEGNYYTNLLQGRVGWSQDGCNPLEDDDIPLKDWLIQVEGEEQIFIGTTDENGFYSIPVSEGDFIVTLLNRNDAWDVCSPSNFPVTFTVNYDTLTYNFPVRTAEDACAYMAVDATTEPLVECTQTEYLIEYCNDGSGVAQDAFIEIALDEELTFVDADVPFTQVSDDTIIVQLGDMLPLDCGSFMVTADVACDVQNLQAAVFTATIYPNEPCELDPNWDMSSLELTGRCEDNKIFFTAKNVGDAPTTTTQDLIVIEDQVLFLEMPDGIPTLIPDEEFIFPEQGIPANEVGSTYRAVVEQVDGHPGNNYPTVAVEGCTQEGQMNYTTGQVTQFPENDQDAAIDIDVQEIVVSTSEEATRLLGHPRGYQDSIIERNTDIEYTIYFANVGSDTLDRLVIRDTIPETLDFSSLAVGPASHPYVHEMNSGGVLRITFNDLNLLPADGSGSEADYRGFVKFTLSQKPNLPIGTVIENRAAVYFDYIVPSLTNPIRHVVNCEDFISGSCLAVDLNEPPVSNGISIRVQPNPFQYSTTLVVEGCECNALEVTVRDASGRELRREQFDSGTTHTLHRNNLPAGIYFLEVASKGQVVQTGKLLVQ